VRRIACVCDETMAGPQLGHYIVRHGTARAHPRGSDRIGHRRILRRIQHTGFRVPRACVRDGAGAGVPLARHQVGREVSVIVYKGDELCRQRIDILSTTTISSRCAGSPTRGASTAKGSFSSPGTARCYGPRAAGRADGAIGGDHVEAVKRAFARFAGLSIHTRLEVDFGALGTQVRSGSRAPLVPRRRVSSGVGSGAPRRTRVTDGSHPRRVSGQRSESVATRSRRLMP